MLVCILCIYHMSDMIRYSSVCYQCLLMLHSRVNLQPASAVLIKLSLYFQMHFWYYCSEVAGPESNLSNPQLRLPSLSPSPRYTPLLLYLHDHIFHQQGCNRRGNINHIKNLFTYMCVQDTFLDALRGIISDVTWAQWGVSGLST